MVSEFQICPHFISEPTFSPDGEPFPRKGYRLVRLEREIEPDYWHSVDVEIPNNTRPDEELATALAAL